MVPPYQRDHLLTTSLSLEAENCSTWKTEFKKFSDEDEFVKFDINVTNVFCTNVVKFNNMLKIGKRTVLETNALLMKTSL